jgi:hypothetical protein
LGLKLQASSAVFVTKILKERHAWFSNVAIYFATRAKTQSISTQG